MQRPSSLRCDVIPSLIITVIGTCLLSITNEVNSQVLNPPYFNLAEGRNISANATCGEGVPEPELYCKLVGANWFDKPGSLPINLIQGQACDYCDPNDPNLSHSPDLAIDGTERWWQSPPLSRGEKYNHVTLTIDLGQEFNVAYVFIKMANSPRPGVWSLEKSRDYGQTYTPWQYFADTPEDCIHFWKRESLNPITRDDSVICETRFSKVVPLEGGEIAVSLLNDRPSSGDFTHSEVLQEWSTATNIRLNLIRPKTTLGHLISLRQGDPTVTRRYFYSIKDINIGGRCVCNGHASQCDQIQHSDPYKLLCKCQHNTFGAQCEQCSPGYMQHKWQRATVANPNACEKCNCFNHSEECYYDAEVDSMKKSLDIYGHFNGGGVCINCLHNTEGINCNKCKPGFYRPRNKPLDSPDVCVPCQCDAQFHTGNCTEGSGQCECKQNFLPPFCDRCSYGYFGYPNCFECHCYPNGTYGNVCELITGSCPCREGYTGKYCKQCAERYYGFPECEECECDDDHSLSNVCDIITGQCVCSNSFAGRKCDECDVGFYDYPRCQFCSCEPIGTTIKICDNITGKCFCEEGYGGDRCDRCADGYFGFPNCTKCLCDKTGSLRHTCDNYGRCTCNQNFGGLKCADCSPGFYKYPECLACACRSPGTNGVTCDLGGRCTCHNRFEGEKCDKCKEGYYNYPRCEECNCNPAGLIAQFGGCDKVQPGKLCECKERVTGRICNQCKDFYWNLQITNHLGCEDCLCERKGTISGLGVCDGSTGQCICKEKVNGRRCHTCKDETYSLEESNVFGCLDCNCDFGGAQTAICDKTMGQCFCKPRIKGRQCNEPIDMAYFPTLYQYMFEIEDWRNALGSPARFGYDDNTFPEYSWRGYAIFTDIQREVLTNITNLKPSLYRVIFRYVNLNKDPVSAVLTFTPPEFSTEAQQSNTFTFEPSKDPKLLLVSGKPGLLIPPLVLNSEQWNVSLKVDRNDIFIDYMVLLPQAYWEPTIFQDKVSEPCKLNDIHMCRHYAYPNIGKDISVVRGNAGFIADGDARANTNVFDKENEIKKLNAEGNFAWINKEQNNLIVDMKVDKPGQYVLVALYHNPSSDSVADKDVLRMNVEAATTEDAVEKGTIMFPNCPYSFICRQIVTDQNGKIIEFNFDTNDVQLTFKTEETLPNEIGLAIDSVAAFPIESWSMDYVTPQFVCIRREGTCVDSSFAFVPKATKVEFEKEQNKDRIATELPFEMGKNGDAPQLILLNDKDPMVDIRGGVSNPGNYIIIVHYYQPDHPNFDIEAFIQNGQFYNSIVSVRHCPNQIGCRAVVKHRDTNSTIFEIIENFMLTLKTPEGKRIWIDYVLVVPADHFEDAILNIKNQDKMNDFLSQCAQKTFHVEPDTVSDYCHSAIFSLTVDYNIGALPCQCNTDGSLDYKCRSFGGQCNCKPNVIGRTCSRCKTGYFGFPNCKQCNCPSTAVCHPISGECICPRGVTGERCDRCLPYTFGFDPIIGCEDCDCEQHGVQNRDLQCHVETGQCNCKRNVVGRTCNKCKPGFWSHPFCQLCRCDIRGTTEDICDQSNSRCFCKENVYGEFCDQCQPDAYYLEESNSLGCTKCFCFGTTDRCTSSSLKTIQILTMDEGWNGATLMFTEKSMSVQILSPEEVKVEYVDGKLQAKQPVTVRGDTPQSSNIIIYFSAPKDYLGNRITSYGGILKYTTQNIIDRDNGKDATGLEAADLVLKGNNITIIYENLESPDRDDPFTLEVKLVERAFRHLNGHDVSREQMMMVLVNLEAIYIRGTFFESVATLILENVLLDKAIDGRRVGDAPRALTVEQCNCPLNYKGTSCEQCSSGHYRARTGPYLGFCLPCQCHSHSNECDPVTGVCFNCQHSTEGDHCEKCISGYHGDATKGTPYDCLICACPLPIASNNFATSCEVTNNGVEINCQCKSGYAGQRCESCAAGHFGRPEVIGQNCQLCDCHGNTDVTDSRSCDAITGECLMCLQNTSGRSCEFCKQGFYGDAILRKNCTECTCDRCGTDKCDNYSGKCECRSNVAGRECNRCSVNHWGFRSCHGCRPCNCGIAAEGSNCDDETGQCKCRTGATGLTCSTCEPGYWKYTSNGCTSCNCAEKYSYGAVCDQRTGQCQCLPGVVGDKCDNCPHRWVFIPQTGCRECGPCVHELLDDTDELSRIINTMRDEMQDASTSVFAYRRLSNANTTFQSQSLKVDDLKVNPNKIDLTPLKEKVKTIDDISDLQHRRDDALKEVAKISVETSSLRDDSIMVDKLIRDAIMKSNLVIENSKNLEESFETALAITSQNIERIIQDAQSYLDEIIKRNFEPDNNRSKVEIEDAVTLLDRVTEFKLPSLTNKDQINSTVINLVNVIKLLSELMNHSQEALRTTLRAEGLNQLSKNRGAEKNIEHMKVQAVETNSTLRESRDLLDNTKKSLTSMESLFVDLEQKSRKLDNGVTDIKLKITETPDPTLNVKPLIENCAIHTLQLNDQSKQLETIFSGTRTQSKDPLSAANAYNDMFIALSNASISADDALKTAHRASESSEMIEVKGHKQRSTELQLEARNLKIKIRDELESPLNNAVNSVKDLQSRIEIGSKTHTTIKDELSKFPPLQTMSGLTEHIFEISSSAEAESRKNSEEISQFLERIRDTETRSQNVPKDFDNTRLAKKQGDNYVDRISKTIIPNIERLEKDLKKKHNKIKDTTGDLYDKIEDLKRKIELARNQANKIKVGGEFHANTVLQLRNPASLTRSATQTRLSLFFLTREPNGLLLYIGNPISISSKKKQKRADDNRNDSAPAPTLAQTLITNDYMSLQIQNGNVIYNCDLGSGSITTITNKKHVYDGQWHQVIVERIGKSVTLIVRTQNEVDSIVEGSSQGPSSVFNLDEQISKIFVGGIPDNVQVQDVRYKRFNGIIEEVILGESPIGLWNFEEMELLSGAKERESLVNLTPSDGLRFDGRGYAILPRGRQNFVNETYVKLKFKTFAKEGLLFLIGYERDFLALEIRDGRVMLKYDLGSGTFILASNKTFNDGQWHSIDSNRVVKEGVLYVDGIQEAHGEAIGVNTQLSTTDDIYIGGYPKDHTYYDVTNIDFEGCIKEVQLGSDQQNLNNNKEIFSAVPGCPITFVHTASFTNDSTGYIAINPNLNLDDYAQITLKFKTQTPRGLLFYVGHDDHTSHIAIYLDNGLLVLRVIPGGIIRTDHGVKYNDNHWHYIAATFTPKRLRLYVDDINSFTIETVDGGKLNMGTSPTIYFGGVPSDVTKTQTFADTQIPSSFVGCLGDATVNEKFQSFAVAQRPNATLTACPLGDDQHIHIPNSDGEKSTEVTSITDKPEVSVEPETKPPSTELYVSTTQPPPIGQCKLSPVPSRDRDMSLSNGLRFGNTQWSRHEFLISSSVANGLTDESEFQIEFKTNQTDGVILYVTGHNNIDFVGLYLLEGKIYYSWNCGSGKVTIPSSFAYNDGEWHRVSFSRKGTHGVLKIDDDKEEYFGDSPGTTTSLNVKSPIYIGGLPEQMSKAARDNLRESDKLGSVITSFPGCLRELNVHGKKYEFSVESVGYDVPQCSDNAEDGSFFHSDGGYIVLNEEFRVGGQFSINMDIKPRTLSGVIIAVFSTVQPDYLSLYMNNGNLTFSVDNGAGPINVTFQPPSEYYFCDGRWHKLQAIKVNNFVNLVVDGTQQQGYGVGGVSSTDTKDPLYIGGVPEDINKQKRIGEHFVGCMRITEMNNRRHSLNSGKTYGRVTLNSCSTL